MAASTITGKNLLAKNIETWMAAEMPNVLSLMRTGIVEVDTNPNIPAPAMGNTIIWRGRVMDTAAWESPTADTAPTTTAISTYKTIMPVCRRGKLYGNEDLSSIAVGEDPDDWARDVGKIMAFNSGINMEETVFTYAIPGVMDGAGVLNATHVVDKSGQTFSELFIAEAQKAMGEWTNKLNTLILHPTVYWNAQVNTMLTAQPNIQDLDTWRDQTITLAGMIGGLRVFLNERVNYTGATYDCILAGPGAVKLAYQLKDTVEVFPRSSKAMGTDEILYKLAFGVAVAGCSYTGTAPTALSGATDANLATAGNWTKVSSFNAQSPIVVIKADA